MREFFLDLQGLFSRNIVLTDDRREMSIRKHKEEEKGCSGDAVPELFLLSEDGKTIEGKKCTEKRCFNE
jgi:hypothetical protein